jgi:hypothetical protein
MENAQNMKYINHKEMVVKTEPHRGEKQNCRRPKLTSHGDVAFMNGGSTSPSTYP